MSKLLSFEYMQDSGHGWLKVPKAMVEAFGVSGRVSNYSYMDREYAYLEEDCDMPLFLQAVEAQGYRISLVDSYHEDDRVRGLSRYQEGEH